MAAIATILGLLLVVTMIANFLATQLPAQMRVNDADHAVTVENQLAGLTSAMHDIAAARAVGGVVSQPVSLGSAGDAPFAGPDGATIGPEVTGSQLTESFVVGGPVTYTGPGGWAAGGNVGTLVAQGDCSESPSGSQNPTSVTCSGAITLTQNFTNGSHSVSISGATDMNVKFQSSYSTIALSLDGASTNTITIVGSHDAIYLNTTGATTDSIEIVGNYNTVTMPNTGASSITLFLVGSYCDVVQSATGATTVTTYIWGMSDVFTSTDDGAATITAAFTGFNTLDPTSSTCPYGNLSSSDYFGEDTDGAESDSVTYNNTVYSGSKSVSENGSSVSETWSKVSGLTCPFFTAVSLPQQSTGAVGAGFLVRLRNAYISQASVAFDQGAVIYAQPGGVPEVEVGPAIAFSGGNLSLWIPEFVGSIGTEIGTGTAAVSVRLDSVLNLALPAVGYTLRGGSTININVTTIYAAAWLAYFDTLVNSTSLKGTATVTCSPATGAACKGPFTFTGPLGTVRLQVPASSVSGIRLTLATYTLKVS